MSTQSLKSDRSDDEHSGEADSGGMMSDENQESPDYQEPDEQDYSKYMPWIKVSKQNAFVMAGVKAVLLTLRGKSSIWEILFFLEL